MQMEAGLDTGPVRLEGRTPIAGKTAGALTAELSTMGAALMVQVLADLPAHPAVPQPADGVTYAAKIDKAEARLDFSHHVEAVERQVRAFSPVPGAFFEIAGERVKIFDAFADPDGGGRDADGRVVGAALEIACGGGGVLIPTYVQRAGRTVTNAEELLRGFPIPPGTRL